MSIALTVIVPAYNEEEYLDDCLTSVALALRQLPCQCETIVVDNGSTDSTQSIARSHTVAVHSIERTSISRARNLGAQLACGEFIAFIDADVEITPEWASTFRKLYSHREDLLVLTGFQYAVRHDATWIERCWFSNLKSWYINGGNIVTSALAFDKIGGFDESKKTGEDFDFCERALSVGVQLLPDSGFQAIHLGYPRTLKRFVSREYWHGEGDFRSVTAFLKSKVAMVSGCYLLGQLAVVALVLSKQYFAAGIILVSLVAANFILTVYKFRNRKRPHLVRNSFLNYLYFTARSLSMFRAIKNRKLDY